MQVTEHKDKITHAVIAPARTIEFGISDSPEFYQMLSQSLYTNQKLAVVREVLCNAWDAHIAANKTTVPLAVTLNNNEMIIQDFGLGIPHAEIGPIYGTYGASTKTHDGQQTGGFGLGCKAPFAYTEHFEVVNCHGGRRVVYAMSKSSAERHGKPGITPLVTLPIAPDDDVQTGVTVKIPIKSASDVGEFRDLIHRIVKNGEMLVKLNGRENTLPTIPFSTATGNWLLVSDLDENGIFIRYGSVIYTLAHHDRINGLLEEAKKIIKRINSCTGYMHYSLVFLAPPHSIAVTPSREALSMQTHTVNTLEALLQEFHTEISLRLQPLFIRSYDDDLVKMENTPTRHKHDFFSPHENVLWQRGGGAYEKKHPNQKELSGLLRNMDEINDVVFGPRFADTITHFADYDLAKRLEVLTRLKLGNVRLVAEFSRIYKTLDRDRYTHKRGNNPWYEDKPHLNEWFRTRVIRPHMRRMTKDPFMTPNNLYMLSPRTRHYRGSKLSNVSHVLQFNFGETAEVLPYLQDVVIFASSREQAYDVLSHHPEFKNLWDTSMKRCALVYTPKNRRLDTIEKTRKHLTKYFKTVIDVYNGAEWLPKPERATPLPKVEKPIILEPEEEKTPRSRASRAIKEGKEVVYEYPLLSSVLSPEFLSMTTQRGQFHYLEEDNIPRIRDPWCFLEYTKNRQEFPDAPRVLNTTGNIKKALVRTLGKHTAVIRLEKDKERLRKAGVPTMANRLPLYLDLEFLGSPAVQAHLNEPFEFFVYLYEEVRIGRYSRYMGEFYRMAQLPELRPLLGLKQAKPCPHTKNILRLATGFFYQNVSRGNDPQNVLGKIREIMEELIKNGPTMIAPLNEHFEKKFNYINIHAVAEECAQLSNKKAWLPGHRERRLEELKSYLQLALN